MGDAQHNGDHKDSWRHAHGGNGWIQEGNEITI
jgi:sarcosine oxidase delta subunit